MENFIEILVFFTLILINGLLAMSEIAIVSARKIRLQMQMEEGSVGAKVALDLAGDPGRFLSTIQIGITLIGILTGVFGGATIAEDLATLIGRIPALAQYSATISYALVVVLTTYLTLVFGELAPKQIGLIAPERVAVTISRPLAALSRITSPLVKILSLSTTAVLKVLNIGSSQESSVTEDEVRSLIGQGTEIGVFEPIEEEMVDQVFRASDRRVSNLITPRMEVVWIDLDDPIEANLKKITTSRHAFYPLARGGLDNALGYVRVTDLLAQCLDGQEIDFIQALQPARYVPENVPAFDIMRMFRDTGVDLAFSIDEYGGIEGIITLQDIIETIIGDIREPEDESDPEILRREDGSWLLDGMLPIEEFMDLMGLKEVPGEEEEYFQTLGGFVMSLLGKIPKSGDKITFQNLEMEVVDMDQRRVDKVIVRQTGGQGSEPVRTRK